MIPPLLSLSGSLAGHPVVAAGDEAAPRPRRARAGRVARRGRRRAARLRARRRDLPRARRARPRSSRRSVGLDGPSAGRLVGTVLLAGFLATTLSNFVGYFGALAHIPVRARPRQLRHPARVVGLGPARRRVAYPVPRDPRAHLNHERWTTRPRNLKEMLSEAKDTSELMVDLGYAALFFSDDRMADEVAELEERLNELVHEMREVCVLAGRSQARRRADRRACLHVVSAIERMGNAAVDISRVVTHRLGIPAALVADLAAAEEVSHRVRVREGSRLAGRRLEDVDLPMDVGMRIVAIRRGPRVDHRSRRRRPVARRRRAHRARRTRRHRRTPRARRRARWGRPRSRRTRRSPTSTAPSTCSSR